MNRNCLGRSHVIKPFPSPVCKTLLIMLEPASDLWREYFRTRAILSLCRQTVHIGAFSSVVFLNLLSNLISGSRTINSCSLQCPSDNMMFPHWHARSDLACVVNLYLSKLSSVMLRNLPWDRIDKHYLWLLLSWKYALCAGMQNGASTIGALAWCRQHWQSRQYLSSLGCDGRSRWSHQVMHIFPSCPGVGSTDSHGNIWPQRIAYNTRRSVEIHHDACKWMHAIVSEHQDA